MSSKLKAITTKAKTLYKSGKYKKWTDAIKAASKLTTKVSGVKKKATTKKKTAVKKKTQSKVRSLHKDTHSHNVNIKVMSGLMSASKHKHLTMLTDHYGKVCAKYMIATGKDKTQLKKLMTLIKREISKYKK